MMSFLTHYLLFIESLYDDFIQFIITDKAKVGGEEGRCRCYERRRAKPCGNWSFSHFITTEFYIILNFLLFSDSAVPSLPGNADTYILFSQVMDLFHRQFFRERFLIKDYDEQVEDYDEKILKELFQRIVTHEKERERGNREEVVAERATSIWIYLYTCIHIYCIFLYMSRYTYIFILSMHVYLYTHIHLLYVYTYIYFMYIYM